MSDWLNEDEPEDLVPSLELIEDEPNLNPPEEMERLLSTLDERERELLKMRFGLAPYGEPHTLEDVGEAFGITRERVRQVEARAMAKLRFPSRDTGEDELKSV